MGHRGRRVAERRRPSLQPVLLLLALGVTSCVVAWGYLVKAAIDFGGQARSGQSEAWWLLAVASLGAVACLFVGLMLVARITRRLGITDPGPRAPQPAPEDATVTVSTIEPTLTAPRVGGHRAAR